MFNPIETRKRLVQERIEKSFQDNIGEQRESTSDVVEKAYNVGDEKDFNGRTYYVHALNAKNQPMWRLKRDGAKKDEEGGGDKKTAKTEEKKSVSDHASEASDGALKRAAADEKAKPEVREAAKKELEKRGDSSDNGSVKEKPSKAKKRFIKDVFEHGGSSSLDRFMEKNKEHFSEVIKKHGFDSWDDFQDWEADGGADENPKKDERIWRDCLNAIPNSSFGPEDEPKITSSEKSKHSTSNTTERPSKAKKKFLRDVEEHGGDMWVDRFMEKNEKHFSEVLKKHGFDSWDDFQKYGEDGPDDYDKIWKKCANAIPNSAFKKAQNNELESVSDLIEEIRNNR